MADGFRLYRRRGRTELRPYEPGEELIGVSISDADKAQGSPKAGDMIARNPDLLTDQWLMSATFFKANYEPSPVEV